MKKIIMGIEGKTSVEYWKAISILLPEKINFETRKQKHPNDVVNAMLNYGYAILASEITKMLLLEKLDPYCGFLHADLNKRTSLTYDIIEEVRQPIVDKTVFSLVNRNQISENDIDKRSNLLKKESKHLLTKTIMEKIHKEIIYQDEKISYYKIIEKQVKRMKNTINDKEKYEGFKIKW